MSFNPFWFLVLFASPLLAQDAIQTAEVLTQTQMDPMLALLASGGSTPLGLVLAALLLKGFQPKIRVVIEEDHRKKD